MKDINSQYGEPLPDGWSTVTETFDKNGVIFERHIVVWSGGMCRSERQLLRPVTRSMLESLLK